MNLKELLISELGDIDGIGELYMESVPIEDSTHEGPTENIVLDRSVVIDYLYKSGYELNDTNYAMAEQMLMSLEQNELNSTIQNAGKIPQEERRYKTVNHLFELSDEELKSLSNIAIIKLLNDIKQRTSDVTYEYAVEVIRDVGGATDVRLLSQVLERYGSRGYKVRSIFTNELGENSISYGGIGTNSTVDQVVVVFEKKIYN